LNSKVAFWQLALYGEIAAIGFWFFLMLGLTRDNPDGRPKRSTEDVRAERSLRRNERYSVVARKVVDLLNTGDYVAVQKLYNPEMSKAFPPKETSDFYTRLAAGFGRSKSSRPNRRLPRWIAFQLIASAAS